jgi:hypothetical protein
MTPDFGPVGAGTVLWAAQQVVRMHEEAPTDYRATGSCNRCPPAGPRPLLTWAAAIQQRSGWFVEREDPSDNPPPPAPHEGWPIGARALVRRG